MNFYSRISPYGIFSLLALFCTVSLTTQAQLRIGARLNESRYLLFENVKLDISIENNTGNDLLFDNDKSKEAHVSVYLKPSRARVPEKRVINVGSAGAFRLSAGQRREMSVILNGPNMFSLQQDGNYEVYVQAGHPRLQNDFRSKTLEFEIRGGKVLWTSVIGVPADFKDDPNAPIASRKASVLWFSGADTDRYALQIEDDKHVYAVIRLGQRISSLTPDCQVDALSNIHILLRLSSRVYVYKTFNYRGRLLQAKLLAGKENQGPPVLKRDQETGVVRPMGGREARRGEDYEIYDNGSIGDIK